MSIDPHAPLDPVPDRAAILADWHAQAERNRAIDQQRFNFADGFRFQQRKKPRR